MVRRTIKIEGRSDPNWAALKDIGTFLYRMVADQDRAVLGIGLHRSVLAPSFNKEQCADDWYFGHRCYEHTSGAEQRSFNPDADGASTEQWWIPRWVIEWHNDDVFLHAIPGDEEDGMHIADQLFSQPVPNVASPSIHWNLTTHRKRYLMNVAKLLKHIQRGDIYEVNYCTERHADLPAWDPFMAFGRMLKNSRAPFAAFHRSDHLFALCASPERFLAFDHGRLLGQPMKGTRPRSTDPVEDARLATELATDPKERSENIMALDVMRNDLSRIAKSRSVSVKDLCVVRSYPAVHQLISSVTAELASDVDPMMVIDAAFPMASMTGAPKIRAMQLIQELEEHPRGSFSGTLGYFAPDGTADLNVVIRTLLYDERTGRASITTGSALTATCDAELEYAECELKAASIINALAHA